MAYYEKKCGNCAATVIKGDVMCRTCGKLIQNDCRYIEKEEDTIEGVPVSDISLFIDKNSSRYVDIFSRNKGKKIFLNMNWSAFFFNIYWMFYRRMYKYAIIFLIVSVMFSIALTSIVCAALKPQIDEPLKIIEPYQDYIDYANENGGAYTGSPSGYREAINEYNAAMSMIRAKMTFWIMFPSLCFSLAFGLLADCIYRRYVIKNCRYSEGGTSIGSMILGIAIYQVVTNLIISPIITNIALKILR